MTLTQLRETALRVFTAAQGTLLGLSLPPEGGSVSSDPEGAAKLVTMVLLAAVMVPLFLVYLLVMGYHELARAMMLLGAVLPGTLLAYRIWGSLALSRDFFLGTLFLFLVYQTLFFGSVQAPALVWFTVMPVVSVLLGSSKAAFGWLGLVLLTIGALYFHTGGEAAAGAIAWPHHYYAVSLACMIVSVFLFVLMVEAARQSSFRRLNAANLAIKELAERDSLTGLFNRRYIWEAMEREENQARNGATTFQLLLVDMDHFKAINDTYGHVTGDLVLKKVAEVLSEATSERHLCGRYGGEEFLLLLRGDGIGNPRHVAESLRRRIAAMDLGALGGPKQVTVSIGGAEFQPDESFTDTFRRADSALYRAKTAGRNAVAFEQNQPAPPVESAAPDVASRRGEQRLIPSP